jgi:uncharacterized membrane protein
MKKLIYSLSFYSLLLSACNNSANNSISMEDSVATKSVAVDSLALKAAGIYGGYLPCADCEGITTYLLLKPDMTYRLEETYYKKDEKVFPANGNWKMNNGKIVLYDKNEVRLSFLPDGNKLWQLDSEGNRISGNLGDKYVLTRQEMADKKRLKEKADAGIDFIGHGNEPFWGLEIDKGNKIIFNNPDMKEPAITPYAEPIVSNGVREYHIQTEAVKLDITISPQFCSDGLSDFLYEYKVSLKYNGKNYSGCGLLLNNL